MSKIFVFIDIWFVKQDIQKGLKTKICIFYGEFEMNRIRTKQNSVTLVFCKYSCAQFRCFCLNDGASSAYNSRSVTTFAYYWTTAGVRTISCRRKFVNVNNGRSNSTAFFRLKQRKQPLVSFLTGKNSAKTDRSGGTFLNLVGTTN